ncbi:hypothetical protein [Streptomyces capillispiralis]|uniref:hypothetical protein n=1 Tax=Streptomyces capillispiralis TaxID=68182 RepID=UPI00142F1C85|nr:hypothetical protein [Streptomyces capillispiralis]
MAVNLTLGVFAIVPLWLTALFVMSRPLTAPGLTTGGDVDDDLLSWLMLLAPPWAVLLGLWIPANIRTRRGTGVSRCRHWAVGSALVLTPLPALTALLVLVEG